MAIQDLFRPRWRHSRSAVRAAAVRALTDERLLARIAASDPSDDVRLEAVRRLQDPRRLAEVVVRERSDQIATAALDRLTDQALLLDLVRRTSFGSRCLEVIARLRDRAAAQGLLLGIAANKTFGLALRLAAAKELDGEPSNPVLAALRAERQAEERAEQDALHCPRCRRRHPRASCRSSQREVSDPEDGAFDLTKTTYYCPLCSIEIGSSWSR
jgi:hypothetical protein